VLLGTPYEDNDLRSSISSSMAVERKSRSRGDKCTSYVVSDDAIADIFFHQFRYILDWFRNVASYGISNILELVIGFGIMTTL
jgi:hypothetical protein